MKRISFVLFVWLIIFYCTPNIVRADDDDDGDGDGDGDGFRPGDCPCWPNYLDDIIGVCADYADEDRRPEFIGCRIQGDFPRNLACTNAEFEGEAPPEIVFLTATYFVQENIGPFGICFNGNVIDLVRVIIRIIRELADVFDDCFGGDGDDRRRLLLPGNSDPNTQQALQYILELMTFTPSATTGAEGQAEVDRLFQMIMQPGGLFELVTHMEKIAQRRETPTTTQSSRRLLDDDDDDDEDCDFIGPFAFFEDFLQGGPFDGDDNVFEFILNVLEEVADDVDCDNFEDFIDAPVRCIIKEALDGDDDVDDNCRSSFGGDDDDRRRLSRKLLDDDDEDGDCNGRRIISLTFGNETESCNVGLFRAATALDGGVNEPGETPTDGALANFGDGCLDDAACELLFEGCP